MIKREHIKNDGEADSGLLHFSLLLITSKSQRRFLVKSEEVKVKVPKTYAFGTLAPPAGLEPATS